MMAIESGSSWWKSWHICTLQMMAQLARQQLAEQLLELALTFDVGNRYQMLSSLSRLAWYRMILSWRKIALTSGYGWRTYKNIHVHTCTYPIIPQIIPKHKLPSWRASPFTVNANTLQTTHLNSGPKHTDTYWYIQKYDVRAASYSSRDFSRAWALRCQGRWIVGGQADAPDHAGRPHLEKRRQR